MTGRAISLALLLVVAPLYLGAQEAEQGQVADTDAAKPGKVPTFVLNLRDADIRALSEQVSEITGRTLILDPTVTGEVTVISAQPQTASGVWDLYQSVLRVQGFVALRSGTLWRVIPQANVRSAGGDLEASSDSGRFDVVTRLIQMRNFPAATAVGALRPLVAEYGYIEALPESNTLVVTDNAENVDRIEAIARSLDRGGGSQVSTIPLRNADATEVAAALNGVFGPDTGGLVPKVSVDTRGNMLLVRGDPEMVADVRRVAEELDQPGRHIPAQVPITRVYRLRFGQAALVTEILRGIVGQGLQSSVTSAVVGSIGTDTVSAGDRGTTDRQPGVVANGFGLATADQTRGTALTFGPPPVTSLADEDITIQPAPDINAVVIRARAEVQADLSQLIAQLDQRRPQVLIEAAIVEISGDIAEQLGAQLGFGSAAPQAGFAATSFTNQAPTLRNILALLNVQTAVGVSPNGLSIGLSKENEFGILIQALSQSNKANLLSTPSVTTLDNHPAEILVGQNVPFRTGEYASNDGTNAFTTIERKDIGINLKVTPRINQGDVVQLDVSQEVSAISNTTVTDAADIITNRRLIETSVLADNGGTVVLGGLITDDRTQQKSGIPGLGNIPVVGRLFSSSGEGATKRVLFVFLRPTILRTRAENATVSSQRFQRLKSIEATGASPSGLLREPKPIKHLPVEINGLY